MQAYYMVVLSHFIYFVIEIAMMTLCQMSQKKRPVSSILRPFNWRQRDRGREISSSGVGVYSGKGKSCLFHRKSYREDGNAISAVFYDRENRLGSSQTLQGQTVRSVPDENGLVKTVMPAIWSEQEAALLIDTL